MSTRPMVKENKSSNNKIVKMVVDENNIFKGRNKRIRSPKWASYPTSFIYLIIFCFWQFENCVHYLLWDSDKMAGDQKFMSTLSAGIWKLLLTHPLHLQHARVALLLELLY